MATGTYDTIINQGDTFSRVITWLDANEDPIILTSYTAKMQLRTTADSDTVVLELSTENGGISLDELNGIITLFVSADDMAAVSPGSYKYDLEMTSGGGIVQKILKGKIKILAEVTR